MRVRGGTSLSCPSGRGCKRCPEPDPVRACSAFQQTAAAAQAQLIKRPCFREAQSGQALPAQQQQDFWHGVVGGRGRSAHCTRARRWPSEPGSAVSDGRRRNATRARRLAGRGALRPPWVRPRAPAARLWSVAAAAAGRGHARRGDGMLAHYAPAHRRPGQPGTGDPAVEGCGRGRHSRKSGQQSAGALVRHQRHSAVSAPRLPLAGGLGSAPVRRAPEGARLREGTESV